jgi:hypothetical protein
VEPFIEVFVSLFDRLRDEEPDGDLLITPGGGGRSHDCCGTEQQKIVDVREP